MDDAAEVRAVLEQRYPVGTRVRLLPGVMPSTTRREGIVVGYSTTPRAIWNHRVHLGGSGGSWVNVAFDELERIDSDG